MPPCFSPRHYSANVRREILCQAAQLAGDLGSVRINREIPYIGIFGQAG